jgi:hypothetical protein
MKLHRRVLRKLGRSNWAITLFSTMVGVLAGFYLNGVKEDAKLNKKKAIAIDYVKEEINENEKQLIAFDSFSKIEFKKLAYVYPFFDENLKMLVPKDSIENFTENTKTFISDVYYYKDENPDLVHVKGIMDINFGSQLSIITLQDIIWNTYKQSDFHSQTSFKCISTVEKLYMIIRKYNVLLEKWQDLFKQFTHAKDKQTVTAFMRSWNDLIIYEEFILKNLKNKEELFKSCD